MIVSFRALTLLVG